MPVQRGAELLQVEHLTTSFTTPAGTLRAPNDVSFTLHQGESLGIVGESGSGKSMLVRTIMNILPPSAEVSPASRVLFEGRDVRALSAAQVRHFWGPEMAIIFQDPMTSLNPVRTIGRQLTDPLHYHLRLDRRSARDRALDLLREVGINDVERRLNQYPHELSGGMRQRVMIAIALSCSPKLLIADEPTTALDVTVQKEILDLLGRIRESLDMAMILISHDLDVVAGRTDRTAVMYAGRVVEFGPTNTLFASTRHPYTEALLEATPRIEEPSHQRLKVIPGMAPNLVHLPAGCSFASRCRYAQDECQERRPVLQPEPEAPDHSFACYFPVGSEAGRAALARNAAEGRLTEPAAGDAALAGPKDRNRMVS